VARVTVCELPQWHRRQFTCLCSHVTSWRFPKHWVMPLHFTGSTCLAIGHFLGQCWRYLHLTPSIKWRLNIHRDSVRIHEMAVSFGLTILQFVDTEWLCPLGSPYYCWVLKFSQKHTIDDLWPTVWKPRCSSPLTQKPISHKCTALSSFVVGVQLPERMYRYIDPKPISLLLRHWRIHGETSEEG
jgi:hypothetical protein